MYVEYIRMEERDSDEHLFVFEFFDLPGSGSQFKEIVRWGVEHFGSVVYINNTDTKGSRWAVSVSHWRVWFRDESDAFEFRMRWC